MASTAIRWASMSFPRESTTSGDFSVARGA
jgi:hypothetical protein